MSSSKPKLTKEELLFAEETLGPMLKQAASMGEEFFEDEFVYDGDIIHLTPEQEAEIYHKILESRKKKP